MTNPAGRLDGRLFVKEGRLCMVIESNHTTGEARVSMQLNGQRTVVDMPLTEVCSRISAQLILDNLNSAETAERVIEREDGWYFQSREGQIGPYASDVQARDQLREYIVNAQSIDAA